MEGYNADTNLVRALEHLHSAVGVETEKLVDPFKRAAATVFAKDRECTDGDITDEMAESLITGLESEQSMNALPHAPPFVLASLHDFAYAVVMHSTNSQTLGPKLSYQVQMQALFHFVLLSYHISP